MRLPRVIADAWHRSSCYFLTASGEIKAKRHPVAGAIHLLGTGGIACGRSSNWWSMGIRDVDCHLCVKAIAACPSGHLRPEDLALIEKETKQ